MEKSFDLLGDLDRGPGWVPLGTELRTLLRHFSIAPLFITRTGTVCMKQSFPYFGQECIAYNNTFLLKT